MIISLKIKLKIKEHKAKETPWCFRASVLLLLPTILFFYMKTPSIEVIMCKDKETEKKSRHSFKATQIQQYSHYL